MRIDLSVPAARMALGAIVLAGFLDFLANYLAAHVLLSIGPFLIPGGTFVFAFGFVVYDYLRRFHGLPATVSAITLGFLASIGYGALFGGGIGRVAAAGLVALACSSATDLGMQSITMRWPIWGYVAASNAVSLLIDTVVFTSIAFSALPLAVREQIIAGQYGAKMLTTLVVIPLVYGARSWAEKRVPA